MMNCLYDRFDDDVRWFLVVFFVSIAMSLATFFERGGRRLWKSNPSHSRGTSAKSSRSVSKKLSQRKTRGTVSGSLGLSLHEAYWRRRQNRAAGEENQHKGTNIAIDLSFESSMDLKERRSLMTQASVVYAECRRAPTSVRLYLTSYRDSMKEAFARRNVSRWDSSVVTLTRESFLDVRPNGCKSIVYLSPDADEVLEEVRADALYVIGGLVDRSRLKNMSLARATSLGVRCARLPIKSYLEKTCDRVRKTDGILNITTVARGLLLKFHHKARSWDEIWGEILPKRRIFVDDDASTAEGVHQNEWTALPTRDEIMAIFPDVVSIRNYNFKSRVLRLAKFGLRPTFRCEADASRPYMKPWVAYARVVDSETGELDPSFLQQAEGFGPTKKIAIAMSSWALMHANPKIRRLLHLTYTPGRAEAP